jgi:ketosteroid isomerase-like protein
MSNIDKLREAYSAWNDTKGGSSNVWLDLMHDHVQFHTMMEEATGLSFAKDGRSKEAAVGYFSSLKEQWEMVHFTPESYVSEGDEIAVFGYCAWKNKATGNTAQVRIAHLWTFGDGKISDFVEVFDSARAAAAASA